MSTPSQNATPVSDLASGCISGLGAMVIMSYLAKVTQPGIIDGFVALISVGAVAAACLSIARARVRPRWKAIISFGGAAACLLALRLLS
jgi:hypothetical protein